MPATVRDWRGLKHQLDQCSSAELNNMLTISMATADQIADFIADVLTVD